jgi:N-acetylneuraminate synthase
MCGQAVDSDRSDDIVAPLGVLVSIAGRKVGLGEPVFVVAEAGSNHNQDLRMAKRLIEAAACAGADAVKFQLFRADWLYPPNCGVLDTPMGRVDFYDVLRKVALPAEWIVELKAYAEENGLIFLCTPFDEDAVSDLASLSIPAFKIASQELNHLPLLRAAAHHQKPIICSTGLSTLSDVEEALQAIRAEWAAAEVVLLQCVAAYPLPLEQCNLDVIRTLREAFGVPVGFSDHTIDHESVPAVAVAAGACVIEKHYTLDRTLPGPDHSYALEPNELKAMIRMIREVESIDTGKRIASVGKRLGETRVKTILGHGRKEIMPAEVLYYPNDKRSIHAIKDIHSGEVLSRENMRILRSGDLTPGLHPRYWYTVSGAVAVQDIAEGTGIIWEHLLSFGESHRNLSTS